MKQPQRSQCGKTATEPRECLHPTRFFRAGSKKRRIPKGFRLKAQGCESASYPGKSCKLRLNPNGVASVSAALSSHNPVGVADFFRALTQGSSPRRAEAQREGWFLATLG